MVQYNIEETMPLSDFKNLMDGIVRRQKDKEVQSVFAISRHENMAQEDVDYINSRDDLIWRGETFVEQQ